MMTRRRFTIAVGTAVAVVGCSAPSDDSTTNSSGPSVNVSDGDDTDDTQSEPDPRTPSAVVRDFYRAVISANAASLNRTLVHPKSPTYPVSEDQLPPTAFREFSKVTIESVNPVSVQDMVAQRLYPNVTRTLDMKDSMGVDDFQLVHTTFYLKKPDEKQAYEAETVDYTVKDNNQWYVRYDATRPIHGREGDNKSTVTNKTS